MKKISRGLIGLIVFVCSFAFAVSSEHILSFIESYQNKEPTSIGPNCFGTAVSATTDLAYTGYMSADEFQYFLNSPLCDENEEDLKRGDLISIKKTFLRKERLFSEAVHVSVFLEEGALFEKATNSPSTQPKLLGFWESLAPYTRLPFEQIRKTSSFSKQNPGVWAVVHSCKSLESFLEENHQEWFIRNKRFFKKLENENKRLVQWTQEQNTYVDALRAASQRLLSLEKELMQSLILRNTDVLSIEELKPREAAWLELPQWVSFYLIKRLGSMNRQVQLLIGETAMPED